MLTTKEIFIALKSLLRYLGASDKRAAKVHTLLDLRGSIPSFIDITDGKVHDVNVLDILNCFSNGSKQHLRIKAFFGTSENAVKTQV